LLASGAVLAGEFDAGDLGVTHLAVFSGALGVKYCMCESPGWRRFAGF